MELIYKTLLYIHIIFGGLALITGLISMISKKGSKPHKKSGKTFTTSMWLVIVSAIVISIMKENDFLLMVGLFSMFQNYYGYRATKNKTLTPNTLDKIILVIAILNTISMFVSLNPILLAFGIISASLMIGQIKLYFKLKKGIEIEKLEWLKQHIGMMTGTYIATITAFLVVNSNNIMPIKYETIVWLTPTVILTPLISSWIKKYTTK